MAFNYKEFLEFSLTSWVKDKKSLKYFAFLVLFNIVLLIVTNFCMYTLLSPFSKAGAADPAQFGSALVYLMIFIISIVFIGVVIPTIIVYFIISRALELINRGFVELSGIRILKMFVLSFASFFVSFFSLFRIRWILLLFASVGMFIVSIVVLTIAGAMMFNYDLRMFQMGVALFGILLLLLSFLGFLAYLIVAMYNSLRLSLSSIIFIEKEKKILDCLKESWDLTKGKIINSFGLLIVLIFVLAIINSMVSLPLQVYTGQFSFPPVERTPAQELSQMVDPVVIVLTSVMILFQILIAMVELFGLMYIYGQLKGNKGQVIETNKTGAKISSKSPKLIKKAVSKRK